MAPDKIVINYYPCESITKDATTKSECNLESAECCV